MSTGDDFYYTGGGFSDWSGSSAGNFGGSSSSSGESSSSGSSNKRNSNDLDDKKAGCLGCGCLTLIVLLLIPCLLDAIWDINIFTWYNEHFCNKVKDTIEAVDTYYDSNCSDTVSYDVIDTTVATKYEQAKPTAKHKHVSLTGSRYYSGNDSEDEDTRYSDDDDDDDTWYSGEDDADEYNEYDYHE